MYDVAVLGAGIAGTTAAYKLRDLSVLLIEAEPFLGGRTRSESYGVGLWANFGAGYFSSDKRTVIGLGDEVGVNFISFDDAALTGDYLPPGFTDEDVAEIRVVKRRLAEEQRNRRDPADPSLDAVIFADWLGPVRPNVQAYWDMWCSTMNAPMDEISLFGVLLASGTNRTSAFSDEPIDHDPRGNLVVDGGNGLIAERLAEASCADIRLSTRVTTVEERADGGHMIHTEGPEGRASFEAREVVCALPAPVAAEAVADLPEWKLRALRAIHYGRIMGMPVVVGPEGGDYPKFKPNADYRPDAVYCETEFLLRSPTNLGKVGAYFVCQVYDRAARNIWADGDETIRAGVHAAFRARFPELAGRVMYIGVHRWRHGLPQYRPGRMSVTPDLLRPVGGISFCGDYTDATHTDGAARSALRAADEVRARLAGSEGV